MYLDEADVVKCLTKAREISEQYDLYVRAADSCLRSVEDLQWICSEYLNKSIEVFDLRIAADDMAIRGMYAAFADGTYHIYLLAELSDRERRFVLCKELFHVLLDEEGCRNMDLIAHVEASATSFTIDESRPTSPVAWEALAEIAAMEFLFPYSKRAAEVAASNNDPDFADIARRYGVPQAYVEQYLTSQQMAELSNITW